MSEILQRGYANRNQFLSVAQLCFKDTIRQIFIDIKIKKGIKGYKEVLREGLVLKQFFQTYLRIQVLKIHGSRKQNNMDSESTWIGWFQGGITTKEIKNILEAQREAPNKQSC